MLKVGDCAPDVVLGGHDGPEETLSDLLGGEALVVYFYPADFSPVCTREACALRDRSQAMADVGVRVVGVSPQGVGSHRRFAETYGLTFPLLADTDRKMIDAFGVAGPFGIGVRRATFLVGADRVIGARVVADLFLGDHLELIEQVIAQRS